MQTITKLTTALAISALAALSAASAQAATFTYFGNNAVDQAANGFVPASGSAAVAARSTFLGTLATSQVENFDAKTQGFVPSPSNPLPVFGSLGALTQGLTASGEPLSGFIQGIKTVGPVFPGRFDTTSGGGGSGKWWESGDNFTLNFSSAINAIGFYGTDFGDFGGALTLDFFSGATAVDSNVAVGRDSGGRNGSLLFFGYANDSANFNRVVFKIAQQTTIVGRFDILGFDDMVVGNLRVNMGVPEPGSLALVALSLGLLASVARRRQRG